MEALLDNCLYMWLVVLLTCNDPGFDMLRLQSVFELLHFVFCQYAVLLVIQFVGLFIIYRLGCRVPAKE